MDAKSKLPNLKVPEGMKSDDSNLIPIIVSIFVVFLTLVVFFIWRRRRESRNSILLLGLSDSGKTLLFSQLLHNQYVQTHTSIKENIGDYDDGKKSVRVVDVPGHERLRTKFFDANKNSCRAAVFVVDSVTFQKDVRDVAEYLYLLLTDSSVASYCPPFLIACNKQDLTMAKGSNVIQTQLEKEMNTVRHTKSKQLQGISDSANNNAFLGKKGKDFEFSHLHPIKVDFVECSCQGGEEDEQNVEGVKQWISKVA